MTQDTFIQTLPTDPLIALVIEGCWLISPALRRLFW